MIIVLAFGFGLGVLATVLAHEYERRRKRPAFTGTERLLGKADRAITVYLGDSFSNDSIRSRRERAAELLK